MGVVLQDDPNRHAKDIYDDINVLKQHKKTIVAAIVNLLSKETGKNILWSTFGLKRASDVRIATKKAR